MKHGRIDANQSEIVAALRACGCTVAITSDVGGGFPDLVVGYQGRNFLLEIKTPGGKLTPDQVEVVKDVDEALAVVGVDYEQTASN